jgi:sterol desaturase/sphingolipid hydroxylase (fatty acid hydroxylase superfamily)
MNEFVASVGFLSTNIVALGAAWIVLFIIERVAPLRAPRSPLLQRLWVNACVSALALGTAYFVVMPAAMLALRHVLSQGIGVLQWVDLPRSADILVGFALMDLSFYYWHVANHRISWLWRFHNVHHVDPDLDVSSAFRFHFGEVALSALFRVAQIAIIGVTPLTFVFYQIAFTVNTLFHHSNVRLPIAFERWMNKLIVTPRMHGIHHSDIRRENQSNFSVVFSVWDRLHRTLRLNVAQSHIVIGIPAYIDARDNALGNVLALPFLHQRDYWRPVGGTIVERSETDTSEPGHLMQP